MPEEKELNPFTDIPYAPAPLGTGDQNDAMFFSDLRSLQVGQGGNNIFRADKSGIWLGGETFDVATFSVSMAGAVVATLITITGGTIKYGKTSFTDSVNAGYFLSALGLYLGSAGDATKFKFSMADGSIDHIGTISGRSTAILAAAISAAGHFIDDRLDTSAKQILGEFTFGVSGAIQIGTYSPGVSGDVRITPNGIVGRNSSNATTLSIDATTGNAYFAGEVAGVYGTFGAITAGTLTGVTVTASTVQTDVPGSNRAVLTPTDSLAFYNAADSMIGGFNVFAGGNNILWVESSLDKRFLYLHGQHATTTKELAYLLNDGLGKTLYVNQTNTANGEPAVSIRQAGTGNGLYVLKATTAGIAFALTQETNEIAFNLYKTSTGAGIAANIDNAGTGHTLYLNQSKSTNTSRVLAAINAGTGICVEFQQNNSGSNQAVISLVNAGTGAYLVGDANFMITKAGRFIAGSDTALAHQGDVQLLEDGVLAMKETTTPTADTDYGKVYTKNDNKLYFQDGAGNEHEIAFV